MRGSMDFKNERRGEEARQPACARTVFLGRGNQCRHPLGTKMWEKRDGSDAGPTGGKQEKRFCATVHYRKDNEKKKKSLVTLC